MLSSVIVSLTLVFSSVCRWPWDKYRMGLSQPPGGPQRSFLVAVLHDLVKLTSWDHQLLLQETPADFLALLGQQPAFAGLPAPVPYPPAPAPPPLPAPPAAPEQQQNSAEPEGQDAAEDQQDEQMADADGERDTAADGDAEPGAGDDADAADAMQQDEQQQEPQQEGAAASEQHQQANGDAVMSVAADKASKKQQDPEQLWAGKLLGVMQSRPPPERKPLTYEQVLEWIDQQQVDWLLLQTSPSVPSTFYQGYQGICRHVCASCEQVVLQVNPVLTLTVYAGMC